MAYIAAALAVLGGLYYWTSRARDAAFMADDLADMASSVLGAAKRWNFRRTHDKHPVDCIDEQNIAIAALAVAFLELGGTPTQEDKTRMSIALRSRLRITAEDADEAAILGHWLVQQCGTAQAGFTRLARRLMKLTGPRGLLHISEVIGHMTDDGRARLTPAQADALDELQQVFNA